jgi:hypothetical protein
MNRSVIKSVLCVVFFLPLFFYLKNPQSVNSTPSTELKDQLSSAQLSYFARLAVGNTAGNSIVIISTSGSSLSVNNYNLDIGDTIYISLAAGTTAPYYVTGLTGLNSINLNTGLGVGSTNAGLSVITPRYATHTISFKPQSSISNYRWQVLIKASSVGITDRSPDMDGFDLGYLTTGAVTCPWGVGLTAISVGTTAVIVSNIGTTSIYHVITCATPAGGTNPVGGGTTGTIVIGTGVSLMTNPAPGDNHDVGLADSQADTYTFILRHVDASGNVVNEDTATGKIALTESVRVTATVDPTLTFSIGNSGVTTIGTTRCDTPIGAGAVNTTGGRVDFGSLILSASTPNNLAQFIECTTNAANGYVIQTFESAPLTTIINTGSTATIPNTTCNGSCSYTTDTTWTTLTNSGFGYALQVGSTSAGAVLGITTAGNYKAFGVGYAQAQSILSRTNTPADTDSAYICYRTTISTSQPAGTYQNEINFIATATF